MAPHSGGSRCESEVILKQQVRPTTRQRQKELHLQGLTGFTGCRTQRDVGDQRKERERQINEVERPRDRRKESPERDGGGGEGGSGDIQDEYQVNGKDRMVGRDDKKEGKDTGGKQEHCRSGCIFFPLDHSVTHR